MSIEHQRLYIELGALIITHLPTIAYSTRDICQGFRIQGAFLYNIRCDCNAMDQNYYLNDKN